MRSGSPGQKRINGLQVWQELNQGRVNSGMDQRLADVGAGRRQEQPAPLAGDLVGQKLESPRAGAIEGAATLSGAVPP